MIAGTIEFVPDYTRRFHGVETIEDPVRRLNPDYDNESTALSVADHVSRLRQELADTIPDSLDGLEVDRIERYFDMLGLPRRDFMVMEQSDIPVYDRIVSKYGWPPYLQPGGDATAFGIAPIGLDLAIAVRTPWAEAQYGPIFTESMLVHELAHTSSAWNEWEIRRNGNNNRSLTAKRLGQVTINSKPQANGYHNHDFLEEAFAAKTAADYVEFSGQRLDYKTYADIAAKGLEFLIKEDPRLETALTAGRADVSGLREAPKILNSLIPGLYRDLKKIGYNEHEFQLATDYIEEYLAS